MSQWKELEQKYYMRCFNRSPLVLVKGKGARVWDEDGKEYLDFVAGIAVTALGHANPVVTEALAEQAGTLVQTSNLYYTVPQLRLAELLVKNSCLDRVFFCNSGAEANEGAVKLARRYGQLHLKGAYEVITVRGAFHGRTLMMVGASAQEKLQKPYVPLPSGFINVDFNSINAIKKATSEKTCAVMLEPIQGESGVNLPDEGYLAGVRRWCDEAGILLILDEIQTGLGRTGTLFAYEQFAVQPDVITLAKGLGNGVPIGAFLAKEKAAVFCPGDHGSTFGGNPLACAAAYVTVKYIIENGVAVNARKVGGYLVEKLEELRQKYPVIAQVRGRGLLLAVEFAADIAQPVLETCQRMGLLVNKVKPDTLRLIPALTIGAEEADEAVGILDRALAEVVKQ